MDNDWEIAKEPSPQTIADTARMCDLKINYSPNETLHSSLEVVDMCRVIAKGDIPKNTLLYSGDAIMTYRRLKPEMTALLCSLRSLDMSELYILHRVLDDLYPREQNDLREYLSRKYQGISKEFVESITRGDCFENIIEAKAMANCFSSSEEYLCVYGLGSKFNHSCTPNCCNFTNRDHTLRITAIRDIKKGEECTITYEHVILDVKDPSLRKKLMLRDHYFICECPSCTTNARTDNSAYSSYMLSVLRQCVCCLEFSLLYRCGRCKKSSYCSKTCQREHWNIHRLVCK